MWDSYRLPKVRRCFGYSCTVKSHTLWACLPARITGSFLKFIRPLKEYLLLFKTFSETMKAVKFFWVNSGLSSFCLWFLPVISSSSKFKSMSLPSDTWSQLPLILKGCQMYEHVSLKGLTQCWLKLLHQFHQLHRALSHPHRCRLKQVLKEMRPDLFLKTWGWGWQCLWPSPV